MPRRSRTLPAIFTALALGALFVSVGTPTTAAQSRRAGAVTLLALLGDAPTSAAERSDYGAGAIADLHFQFGVLRVGGALGLLAVSSADGVRSRVYMPMAASASALLPLGASIGLDLRLRAGLWGGATDTGLDADFFASGGGWLTFAIGGGTSVALGLDVLVQRAEVQPGSRGLELYFSPGVGLVWTPSVDAELADDSAESGETDESTPTSGGD